MSITAETAKAHAHDPAVLCCRAEGGITIEPANLEDPAIFDDLVDSGLLNLDGCLTIEEVLGAKLTKTCDSLCPLTADVVEGAKAPSTPVEEAAEEAIAYVKSFGYLNDWEYARSFIEGRKNRKSRRELGAALCQKGIGREEAERALEEFYDTEDSEAAVRELLRKKKFDLKTADYVQTQKMAGYLMRKGFRYDEIRRVLEVNEAF